jgi:hypothetical protein
MSKLTSNLVVGAEPVAEFLLLEYHSQVERRDSQPGGNIRSEVAREERIRCSEEHDLDVAWVTDLGVDAHREEFPRMRRRR